MQFTVKIDCDNDAFATMAGEDAEIARILRNLADHIEAETPDSGNLLDLNGNVVGTFAFGEVC